MEANKIKDLATSNNIEVQGVGPWRIAWNRYKKNKTAVFGLILILTIILSVIMVPIFSSYTYSDFDVFNRLAPPSREHLLGTDGMGYDVFVRLFYGGRVSLVLSLIATIVSITIGTIIGSLAGYYGGKIDNILMRFAEMISSIPVFPVIVSISGVLTWLFAQSRQMYVIMLIFGLFKWPGLARMIRGQILSIRHSEYILATEVLGLSRGSKIRRHLLPNVLGVIAVTGVFSVIEAILLETTLAILGFVFPYPTPSWGNMMPNIYNLNKLRKLYWLWLPVGLMITSTLVSINLIGEGLRDAFDPREDYR